MHHGNPPHNRVQLACFTENICGVHGKRVPSRCLSYCIRHSRITGKHAATTPPFRSPCCSCRSTGGSCHRTSPSPCIAEYKSTTRHGCGATPPINPRKYPTASCGTDGSLIMPAKGFFPNKNAAPPHARKNVWSVARKGVERENSRKDNTGSHEQPAHANTPLPRISPKTKIPKKHVTSQLQIASAVAAHTPASWACAAPRCSALQVGSTKAPIREHSTTATAVTLPISHKGEDLQWRSGRRHAQSQGNGLPRESRNGDAPLLWASQQIHVSRSPREQHTLNRIQLHYCGHPHSQHECDNAGQEARNNTTHPSHKGQAASVLPSTIIPPHITPLHIRSKKAHTVYTTLEVPKAQNRIIRVLPSSQCWVKAL
ncbi:hypothetical protein ECC02_002824 [Trypanosoma cruzi]|uniref:Uncharacterized protein n=1 Tax=Trypanosoma cruzi TaxID=5693 RepID=A0A7J6YB51_TRYCR|nr:hypothetical protein ECC02_002824 [Trypanosoma cruzi]